MWCVAYGLVPNVRAGAEAPFCYASDMAHRSALAGASVDKVEAGAPGALANYGLDGARAALARSLVHSNAETSARERTWRHHRRLRGRCAPSGGRDDPVDPLRHDAAHAAALAPGLAVTGYELRATCPMRCSAPRTSS